MTEIRIELNKLIDKSMPGIILNIWWFITNTMLTKKTYFPWENKYQIDQETVFTITQNNQAYRRGKSGALSLDPSDNVVIVMFGPDIFVDRYQTIGSRDTRVENRESFAWFSQLLEPHKRDAD